MVIFSSYGILGLELPSIYILVHVHYFLLKVVDHHVITHVMIHACLRVGWIDHCVSRSMMKVSISTSSGTSSRK